MAAQGPDVSGARARAGECRRPRAGADEAPGAVDRNGRLHDDLRARGARGRVARLQLVTNVPNLGEIDVLAGPLPYPDDRKRFEGALSRVQGAREVRGVGTVGTTHRGRLSYSVTVTLADRVRAWRVTV